MSRFSKKQKETFLIVVSALFFVALVSYTYYMVFTPVKQSTSQLKISVENEREILITLRKQMIEKAQADSTSTLRYQEKVPVKPLEDAVLLQVAMAEIKADGIVKDVSFEKSDFEMLDPPESVENVSQLLTTVLLEVDSYSKIIRFVDEIEKMNRIFIVDSIQFAGPEEVREVESEDEVISLAVSFTAFYRADLENLLDEVPKINAPPGSQKNDPFPFNEWEEKGGK